MATMGHGYGSEWHLLRWMGRHRKAFDANVLKAMRQSSGRIEWEDAKFRQHQWPDEELQGIEFIQDPDVQSAWRNFWPSSGRAQTWDAVGWLHLGDQKELILVEAKAHLGEIASNCNAVEHGGRPQIQKAFTEVKMDLGIPEERDWCVGYYQYANRLAALHFLLRHSVQAHLLFIYFVGDATDSRRNCPKDQAGWEDALRLQEEMLGLPAEHALSPKIHKLFLPVSG